MCVKNLSKYLKTAREIPAVLTKVIPIESELKGGCRAAEAISHAADAINKISEKTADKFATTAGKNFFNIDKNAFLVVKLFERELVKMADEKEKISLEKDSTNTKSEDARFDVKSLDEVKDENGHGVFHMQTRTKWIIAFSMLILIFAGGLTYAAMELLLVVENWQLAIWILCTIIAMYSIMARSLASLLFNIVLFFGVSLIPVWQILYTTFRPTIEKILGAS